MHAAIVRSFDAAPSYSAFDEPVPGEQEALVTVTAAGLHPIVKALAKGTHYGSTRVLPFIPGVDGVGRLEDGTRFISARRRVLSAPSRSVVSPPASFASPFPKASTMSL
jgi:NADPH:quinone reductase-like Zn-dependent oxidoreductase